MPDWNAQQAAIAAAQQAIIDATGADTVQEAMDVADQEDADALSFALAEPSALDNAIVNSNLYLTEVIKGTGANCVPYYATNQKMTWSDGTNFCKSIGLEMATARNYIENTVLSDNFPDCWLGGVRSTANNMNWVWENANQGPPVECTFWNPPSEPNNWGGSESCIQMYYSSKWNDFDCSHKLKIVCERRICDPGC